MVMVLLLMMGCGEPGPERPPGLQLIDGGRTLVIGASWRECDNRRECVVVGTSCNGCCSVGAISVDRESEWGGAVTATCPEFDSGCDCADPVTQAVCEDNLCEVNYLGDGSL